MRVAARPLAEITWGGAQHDWMARTHAAWKESRSKVRDNEAASEKALGGEMSERSEARTVRKMFDTLRSLPPASCSRYASKFTKDTRDSFGIAQTWV